MAHCADRWLNFVDNAQATNNSIPVSWQVTAVGDFNRDGRDDLAWRRNDGAFTTWLAQPLGGFASNDVNSWNASIPTTWQVVGTGDFNGDRRDDLIWRRSDGAFTGWLSLPNGGFVSNDSNVWSYVANEWQVVGTGDYNGDGIDDVSWRRSDGALTNWLGQYGRAFASNDGSALTSFSASWFVLGAGDFNGDGRADLLWDNEDTGSRTTWLGDADGGFTPTSRTDPLNAPHYIFSLGDFNGDGRDDMLWRTPATGQVGIYAANPDGSFTLLSSSGNPTASFGKSSQQAILMATAGMTLSGVIPMAHWPIGLRNQVEASSTTLTRLGRGTFQPTGRLLVLGISTATASTTSFGAATTEHSRHGTSTLISQLGGTMASCS